MAKRYNQGSQKIASARFTKAPLGEIEHSKMTSVFAHTTTFDGGDFVPIYCGEVLPGDSFNMSVADAVVRQATLKVPSMDRAIIDIFAYFVPNRVVNESWKAVMGENMSGSWTAPEIELAPLAAANNPDLALGVQIPVGSVADYYGYPTQGTIPIEILAACHDLKFRGYLEIYNNYIRDQNYQPPIPYSKLNVYNGFLTSDGLPVGLGGSRYAEVDLGQESDGSYFGGAVVESLYGQGSNLDGGSIGLPIAGEVNISEDGRYENGRWSALTKPLKANKLHDYFTSVLPSPQKGKEVIFNFGETAPVRTAAEPFDDVPLTGYPVMFRKNNGQASENGPLYYTDTATGYEGALGIEQNSGSPAATFASVYPSNLYAALDYASGLSVNEFRQSVAIQQVYEILGRGGSRYTEYINSFFGLDIDNPFLDIPTCLGHIRRDLDLYQTAQTSATTAESAQGSLAAFGYTSTSGHLFHRTFFEHGYVHVFAVVRHKNIYPSFMGRDNFRRSMMDFYQYPLANIGEQPVYAREINPFVKNANTQVFGYQEAWAEYRTEPDRVSGLMRTRSETGDDAYLSIPAWTYADNYDPSLQYADGDWLQSNTAEVIARGTAVIDKDAPQFKAKFTFKIEKDRPMPTYSTAGLDII